MRRMLAGVGVTLLFGVVGCDELTMNTAKGLDVLTASPIRLQSRDQLQQQDGSCDDPIQDRDRDRLSRPEGAGTGTGMGGNGSGNGDRNRDGRP